MLLHTGFDLENSGIVLLTYITCVMDLFTISMLKYIPCEKFRWIKCSVFLEWC